MALAAQGFGAPVRGARVTRAHFRRVLEQMGVLQLDSVNVLCRSHFLPVFSRLGPYSRDCLDDWLWLSGENVEFLAHEAAITPRALYGDLQFRHDTLRYKGLATFAAENAGYLDAVLAEISEHGAQSVQTLRDPGKRTGPWWGLPKGKIALECLFGQGRLAIARRDARFITWYDLPERVHGARGSAAPVEAQHRALLQRAAACLGLGTLDDLADYFRLSMPHARPRVAELVEDGVLQAIEVEGWTQPAYQLPGARRPRRLEAACFLSPFDPVVWYRPRALRLFDFHYRIEIYVPAAKRQFGYYVLPFLLGDRIQGRADMRANRADGCLDVPGLYAEPGADLDALVPAMARQLRALATWLGLARIEVAARCPASSGVSNAVSDGADLEEV
ncbi:MAG: crosslink repair DNA glycosylase YcaQ family protein [Pseudomonadota bacterium]